MFYALNKRLFIDEDSLKTVELSGDDLLDIVLSGEWRANNGSDKIVFHETSLEEINNIRWRCNIVVTESHNDYDIRLINEDTIAIVINFWSSWRYNYFKLYDDELLVSVSSRCTFVWYKNYLYGLKGSSRFNGLYMNMEGLHINCEDWRGASYGVLLKPRKFIINDNRSLVKCSLVEAKRRVLWGTL